MEKKVVSSKVRVVNCASAFYDKCGTVVGKGPEPKHAGVNLESGYVVRFPKGQKIIFGPFELEFV